MTSSPILRTRWGIGLLSPVSPLCNLLSTMPSLRHQRLAPRSVLYLHRGGYVLPITLQRWGLLSWLVRTTGCEVTVRLYPPDA